MRVYWSWAGSFSNSANSWFSTAFLRQAFFNQVKKVLYRTHYKTFIFFLWHQCAIATISSALLFKASSHLLSMPFFSSFLWLRQRKLFMALLRPQFFLGFWHFQIFWSEINSQPIIIMSSSNNREDTVQVSESVGIPRIHTARISF